MSSHGTKLNIAAYRCMQTLLNLFNQDLSMNDLIDILERDGYGSFNNFVASKYINTCKSCGIDIQKINKKYTLVNLPFNMSFSPAETTLLLEMKEQIEKTRSEKLSQNFASLMNKIHMTYLKSSMGLKSSDNYKNIRVFEKACNAKSVVEITFNNKQSGLYKPEHIRYKNEHIYFIVNSKNGEEQLEANDVLNVKLTDKNVRKTRIVTEEIIYELSGKLAKRYQPRENEMIIKFKKNGSIVVSNKYEDKKDLLKRLMRYDSLCKVLKPDSCVEEMKEIIKNTLKNYDIN